MGFRLLRAGGLPCGGHQYALPNPQAEAGSEVVAISCAEPPRGGAGSDGVLCSTSKKTPEVPRRKVPP